MVRGWIPRWSQRQIPPWTSRTTGQRLAYCVGRRGNTRGVNTFRNAHIAYKRKIERALERCRARERSLLEEFSLLERREKRVQELGLSQATKTEYYFKKSYYQKFISVLIIYFNLQVLPSFGCMMRVEGGV